MRHLAKCLLSLFVAFTIGCGSTTPTPTIVQSCGGGSSSGSMSATVNGSSFVATCLTSVSIVGGILAFGGTNISSSNASNYEDISMAIVAAAPGTYQVTATSSSNAKLSIGGSQQWVAGVLQGGSGTVVIDTLTATGASGTFSFNLVAGPGGSGTKTITNGKFNLTF
jgi:chorismate synthase